MTLNIAEMVTLSPETISELTKVSAAKADSLFEARNVIARRFEGQKRISLDTVLKALDAAVSDYRDGANPDYWTPEGQAAARQAREAEAASQGTPAAEPATDSGATVDAPSETPAEQSAEAGKPTRGRPGGRNA